MPRWLESAALRCLGRMTWITPARAAAVQARRQALRPLRSLPGSSLQFGPPRRIFAGNLAAEPPAPIDVLPVAPGTECVRRLPPTNSARVRAKFSELLTARIAPGYVAIVPGGRYLGDGGGGTVIAPGDCILRDLSPPTAFDVEPDEHHAFRRVLLPPPRRVTTAFVLTTVAADRLYGHWMKDLMPRFWLLQNAGQWPAEGWIIINSGGLPFQRESLERLGVPPGRLIVPDRRTHVLADRLIVPSFINPEWDSDRHAYPPAAFEFVRDLFPSHGERSARRIFISRRGRAGTILNEEALSRGLAKLGFELVHLEELSVSHQARLFAEADAVAGLHGAGFNNLIFARPGTRVLEIFSPDFIVSNFWSMAGQLGMRYTCYCEDERFQGLALRRARRQAGLVVDVPRFLAFAESFLGG